MIHLHVHSIYSMRDSLCRPKEIAKKAKEYGMESIALTDHGTMAGIPYFVEACKEQGVKPIIGCEFYVASGAEDRERPRHLVLLAKNIQGYKNLLHLSYMAATEMFYYKPRILIDWLEDKAKDLVCLTACISGVLAKEIELGDGIHFPQTDKLKEMFGDDLYFEIQQGDNEILAMNDKIIEVANKMNVKVVPTFDVHYINKEDHDAHTIMYGLGFGSKTTERSLHQYANFLIGTDEVENHPIFGQYVANTHEVADKCHLINIKVKDPYFNITDDDYQTIHDLCMETTKFDPENKMYTDRLYHEFGIIKNIGCSSFLMLLREITSMARQLNIRVGRGRGSVCGSLVAYVLGIHDVDPIKYGLYFERFMNPKRVSPPDIDIDVEDGKRELLLEKLKEKYGEGRMLPVSAYSHLNVKSAIRDIARKELIDQSEVNKFMSQYITADTKPEDLDSLGVTSPRWKKILEGAKKISGSIRHATVHASGFLIYNKPLWEIVPVHRVSNNICIQYDKQAVDFINFAKVDILGLTMMSTISETVDTVSPQIEEKMNTFDDPQVFAMINKGETDGCFHIETDSAKRVIVRAGVENFNDLVMTMALNRPGVLGQGFFKDYVKAKETGKSNALPELRAVLSETHGIMIYQEQVMRIAQEVAGLNASQADMFRYSIGKKQVHIARRIKKEFLEGCKLRGINDRTANKIYSMVEASSTYLFNKAHATAYAQIAYQTAYLRKYHFKEFAKSLINYVRNSTKEKVVQYVGECSRVGIKVLPPHVNKSKAEFTYEENNLRFGLERISHIGTDTAMAIAEAIGDEPVESFGELCRRIPFANKKVLENLVYAGACEGLGGVAEMIGIARSDIKRKVEMTQTNLFGKEDVPTDDSIDSSKTYDVLGMVLPAYTLLDAKDYILRNTVVNSLEASYSKQVNFVGMITEVDYQKIYGRTVITLCGLQDKAYLISQGDKTGLAKLGSIVEAFGIPKTRNKFNIHVSKVNELDERRM